MNIIIQISEIQIPMQMLNSMGISPEDRDACWR